MASLTDQQLLSKHFGGLGCLVKRLRCPGSRHGAHAVVESLLSITRTNVAAIDFTTETRRGEKYLAIAGPSFSTEGGDPGRAGHRARRLARGPGRLSCSGPDGRSLRTLRRRFKLLRSRI